jgi:hypothetical protein
MGKKYVQLYFDPGSRNLGQALISLKSEKNKSDFNNYVVEYVGVFDCVQDGNKSNTETILNNLSHFLDTNKLIKKCISMHTNAENKYDLEVSIECQEGLQPGKGFWLAVSMIKMGIISGAIYQFFKSQKISVTFSNKKSKYINNNLDICKKKGKKNTSKHKKNIQSTIMHLLKDQNTIKSARILKWLQNNKNKSQHVYDSVSGAIDRLSKRI